MGWLQTVGDDHSLDHVGEHCHPRATAKAYGDHDAVGMSSDGSVDTDQTAPPRLASE